MFHGFGLTELLVIVGIVILIFGAKRIPEVAKSLGQGLRLFKGEVSKRESPSGSEPDESKKDSPH